jgi:nucleotide-binding universal stress UspA family protein
MTYNNVLVPLDGSKLAESVLSHLLGLAEKGLARTITFVRVSEATKIATVGGNATIGAAELQRLELQHRTEGEEYLKNIVSQFNLPDVDVKWAVLPPAGIPEMILQYASENKVDLIVMATHGRSGISRLLWGSVAYQILRTAYIPVLMVRPQGYGASSVT